MPGTRGRGQAAGAHAGREAAGHFCTAPCTAGPSWRYPLPSPSHLSEVGVSVLRAQKVALALGALRAVAPVSPAGWAGLPGAGRPSPALSGRRHLRSCPRASWLQLPDLRSSKCELVFFLLDVGFATLDQTR